MSVCEEWEDTCSMSLTVVAALLGKYNISPADVGRYAGFIYVTVYHLADVQDHSAHTGIVNVQAGGWHRNPA